VCGRAFLNRKFKKKKIEVVNRAGGKKNLGVRVAEGAVTCIGELYRAAAVAPKEDIALFFLKKRTKKVISVSPDQFENVCCSTKTSCNI
jgi:hypothetical protein